MRKLTNIFSQPWINEIHGKIYSFWQTYEDQSKINHVLTLKTRKHDKNLNKYLTWFH